MKAADLPKAPNKLKELVVKLWQKIMSKPVYMFIAIFALIGTLALVISFAASDSFNGKINRKNPTATHSVIVEGSGQLIATVRDTGNHKSDLVRFELALKQDNKEIVSYAATRAGERVTLVADVTPANYVLELRSVDQLSNRGTTYAIDVTFPDPQTDPEPTDTESPVVEIQKPVEGAVVNGSLTVSGTASDNTAVTAVYYRFAGGSWQTALGTNSWTGLLDTTSVGNGVATIEVEARDEADNQATAQITVTVENNTGDPDPEPPQVNGEVVWQANGTSTADKEWSAWSDDSIASGEPSPDGRLYEGWNHPHMQIATQLGDVLPGQPSYRVYAPVGDRRHEFKQAHPVRDGFEDRVFSEGDETWISWATKLTQHTTATSWEIFNQFRHVNESGLPTGGSPHGLGARSGSPNYNLSSDPNLYEGATWSYNLGIPIEVGKTIKWTFHIKWSSDKDIGFIEVFADDGSGWKQVMPKRSQATLLYNTTTNQSGRNAMRFGIYRDSAISDQPAEIYMSGLTVATTRERAELEAFGQ